MFKCKLSLHLEDGHVILLEEHLPESGVYNLIEATENKFEIYYTGACFTISALTVDKVNKTVEATFNQLLAPM